MRIKYTASLRRKMITTVSASIMAALTSTAIAQEAEEATDEVVVTGIRQALESSLDIKRNAKGIVDSISAEDMGKFPDSNLAESLQRITGVSIDRDQTSGEGKTVTVRGFGADFNLVTFNGRTMPTSTLGNFASAPDTRSFDFGNLAPEAVSRVDIYKTAKAKTASGGMGSTIDIRTTRPLDMPGFAATVGVKQVDDKSVDGSPNAEVSALIYNTFLDDRIGIGLTAIEQSNSHTVASYRHGWSGFERYGDADNRTLANDELGLAGGDVVNGGSGLAADSLHAVLAGSAGYYIDDLEQERNNLQLTFQARPTDAVTLTLDQTFAKLEHEVNSRSVSVNYADSSGSFFGLTTEYIDGPVASPTSLHFIYPEGGFMDRNDPNATRSGIMPLNSMIGYQNNVTELDARGINLEWDVSERLFLSFDFHHSTAESKPLSPYGSSAFINSDSRIHTEVSIDYTTEIPTISLGGENEYFLGFTNNPTAECLNPATPIAGCVTTFGQTYEESGGIAPNTRMLTGAGNTRAYNMNEVMQFQVNGTYDFTGSDFGKYFDSVAFGFSQTDNDVTSKFGEHLAPNWNGVFLNDFSENWDGGPDYRNVPETAVVANPTAIFTTIEDIRPYFDGLGGSENILSHVVNEDYDRWFAAYQSVWASNDYFWRFYNKTKTVPICQDNTVEGCSTIPYSTVRQLEEVTSSAYLEGQKDFVLFDRQASVTAGLRYEETRVTSINEVPQYSGTQWSGQDIVTAIRSGDSVLTTTKSDYDYFLPSIDFDIDLEEDIKLRASYSQTIARPLYGQLAGGTVINPTLSGYVKQNPGGFTGGASEGDPTLEPYESENFDLSGEWYYGDLSYLSLGYFSKNVTNWIGNATKQENLQGLRHVGFNGDGTATGATNGAVSDGDDELVVFNIGYPNQTDREETVDGIEFAIQHDFGDYNPLPIDLTGFGFILNATIVDSDAEYNDLLPNSIDDRQFAIIGISDSHNIIAYYDRFGLSARVAYNWRDRFLNYSGMSSGYTEEFEQVDANISYSIPGTNLTVSYDGINLTEEGRETFERNNPAYKTWINAGHAKHYVGLRWKY